MILVLSGTREGRDLIAILKAEGYKILACVTTDYGKQLALQDGAEEAWAENWTEKDLLQLLHDRAVTAVVDASHPFPGYLSKRLGQICKQEQMYYIRYVRAQADLPDSPLIHKVYTWEDGARTAAKLGETVFLTTGSYNLEVFLTCPEMQGKRVVVRVLPEHRVVQKCQELGLSPRDIVGMQGPFSKELNKAIFKTYKTEVVVTKESGKAGGTESKISAALSLGIPVVVINRPVERYQHEAHSYQEVLALLKEKNI